MNDDDMLGLVLLVVGVAVVSLVVTIIIMILLAVSFVGIHYALAWLVLSIGRSRTVRTWFIRNGWIRPAIYFWLWILPASVAVVVMVNQPRYFTSTGLRIVVGRQWPPAPFLL